MDLFSTDLHSIGTNLILSAAVIAIAYWFARLTNTSITQFGWFCLGSGVIIFTAGYF